MTADRVKYLNDKKEKGKIIYDTTKEDLKEENIKKKKKTVLNLRAQYQRTGYLIDIYNDFSKGSLDDMDDYEYASLALFFLTSIIN